MPVAMAKCHQIPPESGAHFGKLPTVFSNRLEHLYNYTHGTFGIFPFLELAIFLVLGWHWQHFC